MPPAGQAVIYSCLVTDTSARVAIDRKLADMGATPQEVASTFASWAPRCRSAQLLH
jgi:hypothetical protein